MLPFWSFFILQILQKWLLYTHKHCILSGKCPKSSTIIDESERKEIARKSKPSVNYLQNVPNSSRSMAMSSSKSHTPTSNRYSYTSGSIRPRPTLTTLPENENEKEKKAENIEMVQSPRTDSNNIEEGANVSILVTMRRY